MLDCQLAMLSYQGTYSLVAGVDPGPQGAMHDSIPTYRSFKARSEEHTSELQSLMRLSYAVFCLKTKNNKSYNNQPTPTNNYIHSPLHISILTDHVIRPNTTNVT